MLPGPAVPGCCSIPFYFLWAIHPIRPVDILESTTFIEYWFIYLYNLLIYLDNLVLQPTQSSTTAQLPLLLMSSSLWVHLNAVHTNSDMGATLNGGERRNAKTVLSVWDRSNKITRNRTVPSFKDSPIKPLGRRPSDWLGVYTLILVIVKARSGESAFRTWFIDPHYTHCCWL